MTRSRLRMVDAALVAALIGQLAAGLWAGRRAMAALDAPLTTLAVAPPAGPDLSILGRFDPFFRGEAAASPDALPVTALPLTLKGVRLEEASGRGAAFIAGADGQQAVYLPGEEVADGATLQRIAVDHVVLSRDGRQETLWIDQAGGGTGAADVGTPPPASAAPPDGDAPTVAEPPSDSMTQGEEPAQ
jgi:general secretion pathway protein C